MNKEMILHSFISSDKQAEVKTIAYSNDTAAIFITASSLEEVQGLLSQGQQMALQSMKEWKEEPQKAQEEPQKALNPKEEAQEELKKMETTEAGRRVIKSFDNAEWFNYQKDSKGLSVKEIVYLKNLSLGDCIITAFEAAYNYGFRRGYNRRKKERGNR